MSLTGSHIATALKAAGSATTGKVANLDTIAGLFNEAMTKYGGGEFTTVNRVAALVSECMMESAYFMTTVEYANTGAYQPYRGRTFIQLTWSTNYDKFGEWCHQQGLLSDPNRFINHPVELGHLEWAAIGGVWYFTRVTFHGKKLVEYADNIDQIGKAVNLGDPLSSYTPNGMAARRAAFNAVAKLGKTIIPAAGDIHTDTVAPPPQPQPEKKEGVPIMTAPKKFHLTKDRTLAKSSSYHSVPLNDAATTYSVATGPGTVFVTANVTTEQNCWARFITVNYKKGSATKIVTRYPRVKIFAGGDELVLWDTIGKADAGWSRRVRLQVLAYSKPVKVTNILLRAGKEK